jgi:hypothetical protein
MISSFVAFGFSNGSYTHHPFRRCMKYLALEDTLLSHHTADIKPFMEHGISK